MDENRTVVHRDRLLCTCQSSVILFCCQTIITQKDELPKKVSKECLYTSALAISDFNYSRILTGYRT